MEYTRNIKYTIKFYFLFKRRGPLCFHFHLDILLIHAHHTLKDGKFYLNLKHVFCYFLRSLESTTLRAYTISLSHFIVSHFSITCVLYKKKNIGTFSIFAVGIRYLFILFLYLFILSFSFLSPARFLAHLPASPYQQPLTHSTFLLHIQSLVLPLLIS